MANPKANAQVETEDSIAQIENKINEIKAAPNAKTKQAKEEIKRLKSVLNKVYIEYKRRVVEFEKDNRSHLMLLRSTNGFYKLLENSLYFYAFDIAPKLNIDARVFSDGDYEFKSEAGITSIHDLRGLAKKLAKLEIKPVKINDKTGNVVIFKIPWEYEPQEIEKFRDENNYGLEKYNHVIVATNTIPTLYLNLNEMLKICYENVRRLEPVAREGFGNLILKLGAEIISTYIEMTNGRIAEAEGLMQIKNQMNRMKSQVKILVDLKLWNARTYTKIGESIIKIQRIIELKLKNKGGE